MKSYQVIRTHTSPYHAENFEQNERDRLKQIPGIQVGKLDQFQTGVPTILITNTHTQLKTLPTELLNSTELILHSNSGYDHFIHEHELWKNIPVIVGHEIRAQAVAEYSLSCLFQGLSDLPQHLSWSSSRNWDRPLIKDQTIAIYGYGHIGKIVSQTLKTLGARVLVFDPFVKDCPFPTGHVREARVVIVCSSLNSTSHQMFNDKFFDSAHPELIFINGARGKLVKEDALRNFLLSHPGAQAFLDVFETEPFTEAWHHFPQVWKTSHIAGVHSKLDEDIIRFEEKTLRDFVSMKKEEFSVKYGLELLQNKWRQGELI
jgi:D-3-phosphoglycerate dehydrogenase / 2-oxoglutarate reductase